MRRFVLADIVADELRRTDEQAAPAHAVQHPGALVLGLQLGGRLTCLGRIFCIGAFLKLPVDIVAAEGGMAVHPAEHKAKELRPDRPLVTASASVLAQNMLPPAMSPGLIAAPIGRRQARMSSQ